MLKINEIFYSIQGESGLAGWPTVFVRTSGCHLRCTYCDTTYAYYDGKRLQLSEIIDQIGQYNSRHVCVTGGEPLLQSASLDLMKQLCDQGYRVSLETSGDLSCRMVDERVHKVVDVKTPDSGAFGHFDLENLKLSPQSTEFKFVICSDKDFEWAESFCAENNLFEKFNVLYSPSFKEMEPRTLAEKILEQKSLARLQLQLHKYIWNPGQRGV